MDPARRPTARSLGLATILAGLTVLALVAAPRVGADRALSVEPPWRAAGLTEREAAAHALDRFAFGARPGEVDRVVAMGVDTWLARQLAAATRPEPDPRVAGLLADLESLDLSVEELASTYLGAPQIVRRAIAEGVVEQPSAEAIASMQSARDQGRRRGGMEAIFTADERRTLRRWAESQGFRLQRRAIDELRVQKVVRAAYSERQLREVLVDFWFNHFNVSITDTQARVFVMPYERDAIRPHVVGDFRTLLEATARHPAMLFYLDNARSVADAGRPTALEASLEARARGHRLGRRAQERALRRIQQAQARRQQAMDRQGLGARRPQGLNENYARELLELHTLGVDGGYSQDDVIEVARAFTGWAAIPAGFMDDDLERRLRRARRHESFVVEDGFVFRADVHDAAAKTVLGTRLPAGRGIEDGQDVLDLLAVHPSTARHLAHKLAVRFVADEPPPALVERLTASWLEHEGDLLQVMIALVESPELWSEAARHQKIKSPFELAISSVRALGAEPTAPPRDLLEWIERMGQPLYAYQAPTGYPDRADHWVGTGALLNRMNFGLELARGGVEGLRVDLAALRSGPHEPASLEEALAVYAPLLLPVRDLEETVDRLLPVASDPELQSRLSDAHPRAETDPAEAGASPPVGAVESIFAEPRSFTAIAPSQPLDDGALAHVVGVILGSPEFQRR